MVRWQYATLMWAAANGVLAPAAVAASSQTEGKAVSEYLATGYFDVKLTPTSAADAAVGTLSIDKNFHGDLEAHSVGQMLGVRSGIDGSGGYVAMEKVTGTLAGKAGSFILQHSATMTRGTPSLLVVVVPDSGTGELTGLSGTMEIKVEAAKHSYSFRYILAR